MYLYHNEIFGHAPETNHNSQSIDFFFYVPSPSFFFYCSLLNFFHKNSFEIVTMCFITELHVQQNLHVKAWLSTYSILYEYKVQWSGIELWRLCSHYSEFLSLYQVVSAIFLLRISLSSAGFLLYYLCYTTFQWQKYCIIIQK